MTTAATTSPERIGFLRQLGIDTGYMLLGFPLAVASFVVIVAGMSAGLGTLVIVVGLPVLVATVLVARLFADVERLRIPAVLRRPRTRPDLPDARSRATGCGSGSSPRSRRPRLARSGARRPALPDRRLHLLRRRHVVGDGDRRNADRRCGTGASRAARTTFARRADRARRQRLRADRLSDRDRPGLPAHASAGGPGLRAALGWLQPRPADRPGRDAPDDHRADGAEGRRGVRRGGGAAPAGARHPRRSAAAADPLAMDLGRARQQLDSDPDSLARHARRGDRARPGRPWTSCARCPAASPRRCSPTAGCRARWPRWPAGAPCRSSSRSTRELGTPRAGSTGGREHRLLRGRRGADQRRQAQRRGELPGDGREPDRPRSASRSSTTETAAPTSPRGTDWPGWPTGSVRRWHADRDEPGRRADRDQGGAAVLRVVVADDSVLLREGLVRLLRRTATTWSPRSATARRWCRRSRSTGPTSPWWTSGCRRRTPTRACGPRSRRAAGAAHAGAGAVPVRRGLLRRRPAGRRGGRGRLPAQGPGRGDRRVPRRAGPGAAGGTVLDPEVVAQLLVRRRRDDPLQRTDPARAGGARADGRGPLEHQHRAAPSWSATVRWKSTCATSSPS